MLRPPGLQGDLLTQDIDALIYLPAGAAAATVPARLAKQQGIPVVNVDRNAEGEPGDTFIATDNAASAYDVCKHIIGLAGGKGKMIMIHGQKGTTPEVERTKGCMKAIEENPGVELVAQQWSQQWSQAEGLDITQNLLQANPDVNIIFGQADGLALGAAQGVKVSNVSPILEMANMREASRSYEANMNLYEAGRRMRSQMIDLLK